jgi:hypothetical protein
MESSPSFEPPAISEFQPLREAGQLCSIPFAFEKLKMSRSEFEALLARSKTQAEH